MSGVKKYRCLNCGAGLSFDPTSQQWKCKYCFSTFEKKELDEVPDQSKPKEVEEQAAPELDAYHCNNCGAELVTDQTIVSTHCLYCKSPAIIQSRVSGEFQPKNLLPFHLTKEQAEDIYREWIRGKKFAPDAFKDPEEIKKITGVYAPFWLFDCQTEGRLEGEGSKIRTWKQGDYQYTNTKYYRVVREGEVAYRHVPVDASKKLDENLMHCIEPYDYKDLTDFSMQYMSGFMAEKYDISREDAEKIMEQRVTQFTENELKKTVSGYGSFQTRHSDIRFSDQEACYSMMPVYVLIQEFQDKEFLFMINGQTGKVVGEAPVSPQKRNLFAAAVFAAVWVVGLMGGALLV